MQRFGVSRIALAALAASACATASAQVTPLPMAACAGWQGERTCEILHEDADVRVLRCTFPPGVGHEPHYHPPHFGYVLEGDGLMRVTPLGGEASDRPIHAGSYFSSDVEVRHQALNVSNVTMRYLIVEKKYADQRPPEAVAPGLCAN
ncbi:MAG: cupin domain-containing protein [Hyphomonadaceae bacterium]